MQNIWPSLADQDIVCAETVAPPTGLVVFGASGDLASRKLLPGLMRISQRELLDDSFFYWEQAEKSSSVSSSGKSHNKQYKKTPAVYLQRN